MTYIKIIKYGRHDTFVRTYVPLGLSEYQFQISQKQEATGLIRAQHLQLEIWI
jgi:hypothetical protein